jgi:hypothetical protein
MIASTLRCYFPYIIIILIIITIIILITAFTNVKANECDFLFLVSSTIKRHDLVSLKCPQDMHNDFFFFFFLNHSEVESALDFITLCGTIKFIFSFINLLFEFFYTTLISRSLLKLCQL